MQLWKEEPSYYGGDILHQAKKEKIQKADKLQTTRNIS